MQIWEKKKKKCMATHHWVSMVSHRCYTLEVSFSRNDAHSVLDDLCEGSVESWLKDSGDARCFLETDLNACLS